MRIETLKSPGLLSNGIALRSAAAKAISQVEIYTGKIGGAANDKATLLNAFFLDAAAKALAGTTADAVAPAVSTRAQAFGVNKIVVTYDDPLDSVVPPVSAFAITDPARTVTAVNVVGSKVEVEYSGVALTTADTPLLAYTQPTFNKLRDQSGNLAATYAASAVTVAAS